MRRRVGIDTDFQFCVQTEKKAEVVTLASDFANSRKSVAGACGGDPCAVGWAAHSPCCLVWDRWKFISM